MRPLFQRDSFVVLRFPQETLLERTGELELLFFAAKGNHDHTFLYADHSSDPKRLMYYVDTGGNVGNIHRYRLRLLRSDWRRRHIGRTISRCYMGSPILYNRLLGFLTRSSLFLWRFLNFFVLIIRHREIWLVRQIILGEQLQPQRSKVAPPSCHNPHEIPRCCKARRSHRCGDQYRYRKGLRPHSV